MSKRRKFLLTRDRLTPTEALLAKFQGAGDEAALRVTLSGTAYTYNLYQHLGSRKYYNVTLAGTVTAGGEFLRIKSKRISLLARGYGANETSLITYSGTWSNVAEPSFYKGNWRYTSSANAYAQITTPDGTEWVGAEGVGGGNDGMAKITIDGDATLADLLPTAQQLVDGGTLDSTALISNGGTLNPTDRIWDQYLTSGDVSFSRTLSPGVHTVRITRTGYKRAASSGTFATVKLMYAGGSTIRTVAESTADAWWISLQTTFNALVDGPADEISYFTTPTGAAGGEWIGHAGSLKFTVLPTVTVDGATVVPTNWDTYAGQDIILAMQFGARHTFTGATNIALMDTEYRMNAVTGYWIAYTLNWDAAFTGDTYGFAGMMACNALLDTARSVDIAPVTLNANDNSNPLDTQLNAVWLWDADGNQGAVMYIPDLTKTVNDWINAQTSFHFFVKDPSADSGTWNKAYATRSYPPPEIAIAGGEIWQSEVNYRVQWFTDADAELSVV